jgi:excisionase family DNA binding protein
LSSGGAAAIINRMTSSNPETDLISTADAAQMLKVSVQTVQKWMDAGYLEGWRTVGGHRRIVASSVDRFLRERRGAELERQPLGASRELRSASVVLVDDDEGDLELAATLMARVAPGLSQHRCRDGYEGLLAIGQLRPRVVITDVVMPAMDGLTMLRRVLASPARPEVLIAASHFQRAEVAPAASLPDGVIWLAKPLAPQALRAALEAARSESSALVG